MITIPGSKIEIHLYKKRYKRGIIPEYNEKLKLIPNPPKYVLHQGKIGHQRRNSLKCKENSSILKMCMLFI